MLLCLNLCRLCKMQLQLMSLPLMDTGSQSRPVASTPKRKHPATGEGAPVQATVHQRTHGAVGEQVKGVSFTM